MKINKNILFVWLFTLVLVSCASIPHQEKLILTGLVIDEKGEPVSDFEMEIESSSIKNCIVFTNESGVFSLSKAKKGRYSFSGEKEGYTIVNEKREIKNFSQIYCFHVLTADGVFDAVNEMVKKNDYKKASEILEKLYVKRKSKLKECVSFYKKRLKKER